MKAFVCRQLADLVSTINVGFSSLIKICAAEAFF